MNIQLSHYEYSRNGSRLEVSDGEIYVPKSIETALSKAAREYRTTRAGMIGIILAYYFGDGSNHLGCADCGFWCQDVSQGGKGSCGLPEIGEQTTIPLLDKGIVVVGQPLNEQGK